MSENNPGKDETEPKSSRNEDQNDTNESSNHKHFIKTNAVLSDNKDTSKNKEIVIDINNFNVNFNGDDAENTTKNKPVQNIKNGSDVNVKIGDTQKFLTYGEYSNEICPPRKTWVFFQGMMPEESYQVAEPLDYDPESRNSFVALVMSIVLAMLIITSIFVGFSIFNNGMRAWFLAAGLMVAIPAMVIMLGLSYTMACSPCTRMFPCNIICLVLAVIGMSLTCSYVSVRYDTRIVCYAVVATAAVVFVCILLALTRFDFTSWMLYVVMISAAFGAIALVASLTMLITGTYMKMIHLGLLVVGTLITVVTLTIQLQMVLGGKTVEIGQDDYALAAFMLYTSIVNIFIQLVQMLGIVDSL